MPVVRSARGEATFSRDRRFRYSLTRTLAPGDRVIAFVMLNPSTADAFADDPTIKKCIKYATRLGGAALRVVNLFALRATDPAELALPTSARAGANATNDAAIRAAVRDAHVVIAAWGVHGGRFDEHARVRGPSGPLAGVPLRHLGLTRDGFPRHPLYRRDDQRLAIW